MYEQSSAVDVFDSQVRAGGAINALRKARFDVRNVSIVGKDFRTEEHPIGFYNVPDGMKFSGKSGLFWGGLWGWMAGAGLFLIPGVGHVIVLGPLVGSIVGALEGASLGAGIGVLGAALASVGISADSAARYEAAVRDGKFVIALQGSTTEVGVALQTLANGALDAEVRMADCVSLNAAPV